MTDDEFEFPPDRVEEELQVQAPYGALSLSALVSMPADQLPRTQPPGGAPRSLRQTIRGVGGVVGYAAHSRATAASHTRGGKAVATSNPLDRSQSFATLFGSIGDATGGPSHESRLAEMGQGPREAPASEAAALTSHSSGSLGGAVGGPPQGNRRSRTEWTDGDVRKFYRALSQYGTDFAAVAVHFPSHTREEVKRLYHRELRRHPSQVRAALRDTQAIDIEAFSELLRMRQAREAPPTKELNVEEEDMLRAIAHGSAAAPTPGADGKASALEGPVAAERRRPAKRRRQDAEPPAAGTVDAKDAKQTRQHDEDPQEETYLETALRLERANVSFAEAALAGEYGEFDFDDYDL